MPPAKNAVQKILDEAGKFVTTHKGAWEHSDWEEFLSGVEKQGFQLSDEVKRNVGNILEASKALYHGMPSPQPKKTAKKRKAEKATKKTD